MSAGTSYDNKTFRKLATIVVICIMLLFTVMSFEVGGYYQKEFLNKQTNVKGIGLSNVVIKDIPFGEVLVDAIGAGEFCIPCFNKYFWYMEGIGAVASFFAVIILFSINEEDKRLMKGKEKGSARMLTPSEYTGKNSFVAKKITNPIENQNFIISKNVMQNVDGKTIDKNGHFLICGGSGAGKSFTFVKPNLFQMSCTYLVTDPSSDLFRDLAPFLSDKGIPVYCLNINDMKHSNFYNPLDYIYDEDGEIDDNKVQVLVSLYMENAKEGNEKGGQDPFWDKAERGFITGMIYYVVENPKYKADFPTILELSQKAKTTEPTKTDPNPKTELTKEIEAFDEECKLKGIDTRTMVYYKNYLIAPPKTGNTVLMTTVTDLQFFANRKIARICKDYGKSNPNSIPMLELAEQQCYLFMCIPATNEAFNFLISMFYSQLFDNMYDRAPKYRKMARIRNKDGITIMNCIDKKDGYKENIEYAKKMLKELSEDNIIEVENSPYYCLEYENKVYARSFSKEYLKKLINDGREGRLEVRKASESEMELPNRIICLLDEFKNIGKIPKLNNVLTTCRKYHINIAIILQDLAQIKEMYPDDEWKGYVTNCDTQICMGAKVGDTTEYFSKLVGKKTQTVRNISSSKQGASSSYNQEERPILTEDEIASMNEKKKQILFKIGDLPAILDEKYWPLDNPKMVELLKECSKYDVDKFMKNYEFIVAEENIIEKETTAFKKILSSYYVESERED